MELCKYWRIANDEQQYCTGTKECDFCNCKGNKDRCNFPFALPKPKSYEMNLKDFVEKRKSLCDRFVEEHNCFGCPLSDKIDEYKFETGNFLDCWEFIETYPDEACAAIKDYKLPPVYPNWYDWLHKLHRESKSSSLFCDWLMEKIPEAIAKKYNIEELKEC